MTELDFISVQNDFGFYNLFSQQNYGYFLNLNLDEFISLVLKMYGTPDEETRQVITEGLRKMEKEFTNKAGKLISKDANDCTSTWYGMVFKYLYSAPQQRWAKRDAFGSITSKKRDKF